MKEAKNEHGEPIYFEGKSGETLQIKYGPMGKTADANKFTYGTKKRCPKCGHEDEGWETNTYCYMRGGETIAATGHLCPICLINHINSLGLPVMEDV